MKPHIFLISALLIICLFLWLKYWQAKNLLEKTQLNLIELTLENRNFTTLNGILKELLLTGHLQDAFIEIEAHTTRCDDNKPLFILFWSSEACNSCHDFAIEYWKSIKDGPGICSLFVLNNFSSKEQTIFENRYGLTTILVNQELKYGTPFLLIVDRELEQVNDVLIVSKENTNELNEIRESLIN